MAIRGSYAKGIARREEILRTALDVFAERGYRGTSVRELAAAAGLSQAGLLHYFDSKEELYAEILRKRDDLAREQFGEGNDDVTVIIDAMKHNAEVPGLARLFANLSTAATEPGHPAHDFFAHRYADMRAAAMRSIRVRQAGGQIDPRLDADKLATIILALSDGLQVQWLFDPELDMGEHVGYLWELLTSASFPQAPSPAPSDPPRP
jgi:AcrR family transcriptional regulator